MNALHKLANQVFFHFWWVIAFIIACSILFEQSLKEKSHIYQELTEQLTQLQKAKAEAIVQQHDLLLQINSQNDPAWIELTLIRELGLIPEGQQKIYFYPD
jgi:hypothetical protein